MISDWIRNHRIPLIFVLFVLGFVIFKIQDLTLPFYWDEAWPSSQAIFSLFENGNSLSPAAISHELNGGAPVLFQFLIVFWMNIFGTSLFAVKSFTLLLSVILLISIYFGSRKLFNKETALIATLVFGFQAIFLAQSSFALPEIQFTLFLFWSFYFYLRKKSLLFILFSLLSLLTKESGILLVSTLFLWEIFRLFFPSDQRIKLAQLLKNFLVVLTPVLIFMIYYLALGINPLNHLFYGNADFGANDFFEFKNKLWVGIGFVFFDQGRWFITFMLGFLLLVRYFIFREVFGRRQWESIQLFMLFIILFLILSSLSFLSNRFLLVCLPFFSLIFAIALADTFKNYKQYITIGTLIILGVIADFDMQSINNEDSNLGFRDEVKIHQEMVNYCEKQQLYNKTIYTHFLMNVNLSNPYAGYLTDSAKRFTEVVDKFSPEVDYCIFSNIEYQAEFGKLKRWYNLELKKKFKKNTAWVELYKVNPITTKEDSILMVKHGKLVNKYILEIRGKEEWLQSIQDKASERNISVDSMIKLDAIFMADEAMGK